MSFFLSWSSGVILTLTLIAYWRIAKSLSQKRWILILCSGLMLGFLHPFYTCVAFIALSLLHVIIQHTRHKPKSTLLPSLGLIGGVLLSLLFLKYGGDILSQAWGDSAWISQLILKPLGMSYLALRIIQYILDTQRGLIQCSSLSAWLQFIFFFPLIPAGPIETYQHFYQNQKESFDARFFTYGLQRVLWGLFKKLFILETFLSTILIPSVPWISTQPDILTTPLQVLTFSMYSFIYAWLDLSAYTDVAIGLSALFGFKITENFYFPFIRTNISAFWNSWHISVSNWCRNSVYFPVYGLTRKPWIGLYAAMITMGCWHSISLNWIAWGAYHATGLTWHSYWVRFKKKHPRVQWIFNTWLASSFSWAMTLIFVGIGFIFIGTQTILEAVKLFKIILGF